MLHKDYAVRFLILACNASIILTKQCKGELFIVKIIQVRLLHLNEYSDTEKESWSRGQMAGKSSVMHISLQRPPLDFYNVMYIKIWHSHAQQIILTKVIH